MLNRLVTIVWDGIGEEHFPPPQEVLSDTLVYCEQGVEGLETVINWASMSINKITSVKKVKQV